MRVIGDSHTWAFQAMPSYHIHWQVSKTMFGLRKEPDRLCLDEFEPGEHVCFVFGEIDVRMHVIPQNRGGRAVEEILSDLVNSYLAVVQHVQARKGIQPLVASILPPCDGDFVRTGTLQERVQIQKRLNDMLEGECERRHVLFFRYDHLYALSDGSLDMSRSDGIVHIRPECGEQLVMALEVRSWSM